MPQAVTVRPHKNMRLVDRTDFIVRTDTAGFYILDIDHVVVKFNNAGNVIWSLCRGPKGRAKKVEEINPFDIVGIDNGATKVLSFSTDLSQFVGAFHVDDRRKYRTMVKKYLLVA